MIERVLAMVFRAKAIIVRNLEKVKIVFFNHETIYVLDKQDGKWHIFHRWFHDPLSQSYNRNWRPFRHLMLSEKKLDINHCYRLAFRYEINSQVGRKAPDLSGKNIEERSV